MRDEDFSDEWLAALCIALAVLVLSIWQPVADGVPGLPTWRLIATFVGTLVGVRLLLVVPGLVLAVGFWTWDTARTWLRRAL